MKKLDWYIIKKFLGAFFFMIAAFCVIAVVFDLSENVDDLITNHAPFSEIIVDYYLNFCLHFGNMLSGSSSLLPLFSLLQAWHSALRSSRCFLEE